MNADPVRDPSAERPPPASLALDRLALAVAASLLEQGRVIDGLSRLVTALAVVGTPILATLLSPLAMGLPLVVIALGLLQTWLASRVGFDAALFSRLAASPGASTEAFDRVMTHIGLLPPGKAGRPWDLRIAGARRLMAWQAVAMLAQVGVAMAAAVLIVGMSR
jgi:hypothetical protein